MRQLPTIREVVNELRDERNFYRALNDTDWFDARLIVGGDGSWVVETGDSSYDLWHGIACGAVYIPVKGRCNLYNTVRDLLAQVTDQLAERAS